MSRTNTVLVTGATGLIGAAVVEALLAAGVRVARDASVEHVVSLSSMNAAVAQLNDPLHKPLEAAVEAAGVRWTHLRCGEFAHSSSGSAITRRTSPSKCVTG